MFACISKCLNVPVGCRAQALFDNQQADGGFLRVQALYSPAFYAPQLAEMEPRVTAYSASIEKRASVQPRDSKLRMLQSGNDFLLVRFVTMPGATR